MECKHENKLNHANFCKIKCFYCTFSQKAECESKHPEYFKEDAYKIFEVTYNDGGWHSGGLPHFFYIAKSKEEVISHSKKYQEYRERQMLGGGDILIQEVSGLMKSFYFENLEDFNITMIARRKDQ